MRRTLRDEEKDYCINRLPLAQRLQLLDRCSDQKRFKKHDLRRVPVYREISFAANNDPVDHEPSSKLVCATCGYEPENPKHQSIEVY